MTVLSKLCEEDNGTFLDYLGHRLPCVLVTGSDRGIGLGLVKRFLELPSPPKWVFATTLDLEGKETKEVKELACNHPNLVLLQLDVTKPESIQAALKEVEKCVGESGLTLLINNAGIGLFNDLETENAKDMMTVYSINTIGPLLMSQAFLPLLKKAAWRSPCQELSSSQAAIINISSSAGSMEVMLLWDKWEVIGYRCSKAALNMLTKCQSLEYPPYGILSVCIHPGWVRTNYKDDNGTFVDWLGGQVPCVLVTGSDRGIGLGLVKRFLELPSPPKWVFATTLDLEGEDNQPLTDIGIILFSSDVTKLESVQEVVKEVQKCVGESGLTLLINNAGVHVGSDLDRENAKDMMKAYSVNTIGPLQMSQACLPLLKLAARRNPCQGLSACKAAIINISSILSSIELLDRWETFKKVAYRCSKTALNMLTKCQSLDYSAHGILCVAIHPGQVNTTGTKMEGNISLEESTKGIMTVLSMLSEEDNGTFVD
ncbi:hypothetical protein L345_12882, partial [Ophiophagus hannah]